MCSNRSDDSARKQYSERGMRTLLVSPVAAHTETLDARVVWVHCERRIEQWGRNVG
jgi:hypothetical protein